MQKPVVIHKGRTNIVTVGLGINVSADTITSQVRKQPSQSSELLATWSVTFASDGSDGELILTMDDLVTKDVKHTNGYMDLKRVSNGEPISVFRSPIPVIFEGTVTA